VYVFVFFDTAEEPHISQQQPQSSTSQQQKPELSSSSD
jgi:hypothetical protein